MKMLPWRAALAALVFMASGSDVFAQEAARVPVESFYRGPDIESVALSPSGRYLALLTGAGAPRVSLAVVDLAGGQQIKVVARYADIDVEEFHWVNDDLLVYTVTDRTLGGGDQRYAQGLFSVRADGSERRQWVKLHNALVTAARLGSARDLLEWNHRLLWVPQKDGNTEVILERYEFNARREVERVIPLALDLTTRATRSLAMNAPDDVTQWWFAPNGEARVIGSNRSGVTRYFRRGTEPDTWMQFAEFDTLDAAFVPHSIDNNGQLYITARDGAGGFAVLKRWDLANDRPQAQALVSTPGFDFRGNFINARGSSGPPLGVRVLTDAETTHWFDPRMKTFQALADQQFPGEATRVNCRRCTTDAPVLLVTTWSDRNPGQVYLYDVASKRWTNVGATRKDIDPRRMATLDLHRVKARDGLELPVWLALPPGADKTRPLPAVVLAHGGPWIRGWSWTWDADIQFLASRGYAVIAPEFRGSDGYGRRHFRAGWKQWGQAMQDDLADALGWAAAQGWVDPKRTCIAGASYGGYAVLASLMRHPDLYRCGVAWAAVTDPRLLFELDWINNIPQDTRQHTLPVLIGDPVKDADLLAAAAPLAHADKIKAPVLLAFGRADPRVPIAHGERMRAALRAAGNEPEWVVYPDEGHGWYKAETRYDFARRVEKFLAEHLK